MIRKEIIPAKYLEITEDQVELLCNIGTFEKPYLEARLFSREPLEDVVKDFPEYPRGKFCVIEITTETGRIEIKFTQVDGDAEFEKNFIKEDVFKGLENSAFFKEG